MALTGATPKRPIIRDEVWKKAFDYYMKLHKQKEPNEYTLMWANGSWRAYMWRKEEAKRRAEKSIKLLDKPPPIPQAAPSRFARSSMKTCQAVTLSGRPCRFRATSACGKYCRKHIVKDDKSSTSCDIDGDLPDFKSALAELSQGTDWD